MSFDQSILGNHDQGALFDPEGFSSGAERAIFWTRDQLEMPTATPQQTAKRWEFLSELPRTSARDRSPSSTAPPATRSTNTSFPKTCTIPKKLERLFALVDRYCFQGHTHVPGVFTEDGRFLSPDDVGGRYPLLDFEDDGQRRQRRPAPRRRPAGLLRPAHRQSDRVPPRAYPMSKKPPRKSTPSPSSTPSSATASKKAGQLFLPARALRLCATGSASARIGQVPRSD